MEAIDYHAQLRRQLVFARRKAVGSERAEGDWWLKRLEALRIERDQAFGTAEPEPELAHHHEGAHR